MQCEAVTVAGVQCRGTAMRGSKFCNLHIGGHVGSKLRLTPEVIDSLVAMLRAGNYVGVACLAVGVDRRTFGRWMRQGRSAAPADTLFRELRERVEKARAEGEVRNVALISQQATDNWQAAAWMLERQYPERWGRVSVRFRDEAAPAPPADATDDDDPFAEVVELANRRRQRAG